MTSSLESEREGFLASLFLERRLSENTCTAYRADLESFFEWLSARGKREPGAVTRDDIVLFLSDERTRGMRGSTRRRRTAAIRAFFRFLCQRHRIPSDPTELMEASKKELALPRVLSREEVFGMIAAVEGDDPRAVRDRAILEVLYGCGMRVSELCEFKVDDVVSDGELVRILGKGAKVRLVPIGKAAGRALTDYLTSARAAFSQGDVSEGHVFLSRLGKPLTRQGVFKIVRERAAAVGIAAERISPHVLRHCFASHMLQNGADIRFIQEMLGHADVGTTQIYTHVDTSRFAELHRKFHPRAE